MSRERELLRRALEAWETGDDLLVDEELHRIQDYLAAEEGKEGGEPVAFAEYDPHGNLCALLLCSGAGLTKEEIEYGWKLEPLFLHPPKPAEPEAETIETLKAENFKLASGQCTEGGPWGDEGGTPYCKYAKRKPMTAKEMLKGIDADTYPYEEVLAFVTGIRYAEKHHGITDADV